MFRVDLVQACGFDKDGVGIGLVQIDDFDAGQTLILGPGGQIEGAGQLDGVDAVTTVDIPGGVVANGNDVVFVAGSDGVGATPVSK